jgi:hypothetical protein
MGAERERGFSRKLVQVRLLRLCIDTTFSDPKTCIRRRGVTLRAPVS